MSTVIQRPAMEAFVAQTREIFDAHLEPPDLTMRKKLIINIAPSGSFIDRRHNPNLPITTEAVRREVRDAYNAGAAMWHFHPRDPELDTTFVGLERRLEIHREWCDAVFEVAPDIITNVGGNYVVPPSLKGTLVEEESIQAEARMAPLIDRLVAMGPNNRYVDVAIILCHTAALGGVNVLSFNNRSGIQSDVKLLRSRGIRIELSPFKHSDLQDVTEWVFNAGLAMQPIIVDTLLGIHNSPKARPALLAYEMLLTYVRMIRDLPGGVLWQSLMGGRNWLPLTVAAIALGADIVRIGMEDEVYMYPFSDERIASCGRVVEAVSTIARMMGREVATAQEAREILRLNPVA